MAVNGIPNLEEMTRHPEETLIGHAVRDMLAEMMKYRGTIGEAVRLAMEDAYCSNFATYGHEERAVNYARSIGKDVFWQAVNAFKETCE